MRIYKNDHRLFIYLNDHCYSSIKVFPEPYWEIRIIDQSLENFQPYLRFTEFIYNLVQEDKKAIGEEINIPLLFELSKDKISKLGLEAVYSAIRRCEFHIVQNITAKCSLCKELKPFTIRYLLSSLTRPPCNECVKLEAEKLKSQNNNYASKYISNTGTTFSSMEWLVEPKL